MIFIEGKGLVVDNFEVFSLEICRVFLVEIRYMGGRVGLVLVFVWRGNNDE